MDGTVEFFHKFAPLLSKLLAAPGFYDKEPYTNPTPKKEPPPLVLKVPPRISHQ